MKISVILCAYNASRYIREAMDSILAQTYNDWEAICIDDGSTDDSGHILDEYAKKERRFKVYHQTNKGVAASRNLGVSLSTGDYFTFCDADDLLAPYWFANAAELIDENHPDLLRAHLEFETKPSERFFTEKPPRIEKCFSSQKACLTWAWSVLFNSGFAVINFISKDIKPFIHFPENFIVKEDSVALINLAPHLRSVIQSDCLGYFYRNTPNSMLRKKRVSQASVIYLNALAEIWCTQRVVAGNLGLIKDLRHAIQQYADNDVLDWAIESATEPYEQKRIVRETWKMLRESGAFDNRYYNRFLFYFPFQWWKMCGQEFPIKLTWKIFLLARKLLPRKLVKAIKK